MRSALLLSLGVLLAAGAAHASSSRLSIKNRRIQPRQTLSQALSAAQLAPAEVMGVLAAMEGVFDFRKSRVGDQLRLVLREGALEWVDYRQGPLDEWQVRREGTRFVAARREVVVERQVEQVELSIESSLYEAALSAGEDPAIGMALADVFAWDIDFYRDVRRGDRARALVEKVRSKGRFIRYGEVLAAQYEGEQVGRKRVFRYLLPDGQPGYYQEDGSSARRAFLKSPLKYAHVTSRFGSRFHPVLQYVKDHNGVDYAAAVGTPVWAVADGVVTVAGNTGAGGNTVCLRHANGFETCYLHLSRYGAGVRVGSRVSQKQVIALSGNTGRSTGPHLHFGMKRNGRYINPLNQNFPRSEPVPKELLADFRGHVEKLAEQLDTTSLVAVGARP